jgi:hypothetical protein
LELLLHSIVDITAFLCLLLGLVTAATLLGSVKFKLSLQGILGLLHLILILLLTHNRDAASFLHKNWMHILVALHLQ